MSELRAIALDVGGRYVGVSAVDHSGKIPYRHSTIDRKQQDVFAALKDIAEKEQVSVIVVGVPYHVEDGSETDQTRKTREFIFELEKSIGGDIQYVEIDETLTSREAKELLKIEGADTSEEHAEAARILLAEYLAEQR